MTRLTSYKCDECGAILEGSARELRKNGAGWRSVKVYLAALTHEDIAELTEARTAEGEIERDYCPAHVPEWAKPQC